MSHKRRWWTKDEQFKQVYERLRKNYEQNLAQAEARLQAEFERKLDGKTQWYRQEVARIEREAQDVIRGIAKVRVEFGPSTFGTRWQMNVILDDNFMKHMSNLKEVGPYVIRMLCAKIEREFASVDFGRAKMVQDSLWEHRHDPPTFRIEAP